MGILRSKFERKIRGMWGYHCRRSLQLSPQSPLPNPLSSPSPPSFPFPVRRYAGYILWVKANDMNRVRYSIELVKKAVNFKC